VFAFDDVTVLAISGWLRDNVCFGVAQRHVVQRPDVQARKIANEVLLLSAQVLDLTDSGRKFAYCVLQIGQQLRLYRCCHGCRCKITERHIYSSLVHVLMLGQWTCQSLKVLKIRCLCVPPNRVSSARLGPRRHCVLCCCWRLQFLAPCWLCAPRFDSTLSTTYWRKCAVKAPFTGRWCATRADDDRPIRTTNARVPKQPHINSQGSLCVRNADDSSRSMLALERVLHLALRDFNPFADCVSGTSCSFVWMKASEAAIRLVDSFASNLTLALGLLSYFVYSNAGPLAWAWLNSFRRRRTPAAPATSLSAPVHQKLL
jgi:hypothetical protein